MDAPERIWATEDAANFGEDKFHTTRPMSGLTEYIRADLCADPALLAEAVEVLDNLLEAISAETQHGDRCLTITGPTANLKWLIEAGEDARAFIAKLENRHDR